MEPCRAVSGRAGPCIFVGCYYCFDCCSWWWRCCSCVNCFYKHFVICWRFDSAGRRTGMKCVNAGARRLCSFHYSLFDYWSSHFPSLQPLRTCCLPIPILIAFHDLHLFVLFTRVHSFVNLFIFQINMYFTLYYTGCVPCTAYCVYVFVCIIKDFLSFLFA